MENKDGRISLDCRTGREIILMIACKEMDLEIGPDKFGEVPIFEAGRNIKAYATFFKNWAVLIKVEDDRDITYKLISL